MPALAQSVSRRFACLLAVLCISLAAPAAHASVTFNWSGTWSAGSPTNGQTKTQQFTSVTANDITVSIYNSGMTAQGGYPAIDSTETTSGLSGVNGLQLYASKSAAVTSFYRVTVSFATPVTNLSFSLWDCDASAGQFVDKFQNIQALAVGGATVGADSFASEVAGYNTISGSGLSAVISGTAGASNTTNQGTVDIAFNQPITQFSFEWSNSDSGHGAQAVGLSPIVYTIVPEGRSGLVTVGSCAAAVLCEFFRRRRAKAAIQQERLQARRPFPAVARLF